jgi:hypothetical protein
MFAYLHVIFGSGGLQPERATHAYPGAEERDAEKVFIILLRIISGVVRDRRDYPFRKVAEPLEESTRLFIRTASVSP